MSRARPASGSPVTRANGAARRRSAGRSSFGPTGSPTAPWRSTIRSCAPSCRDRGITLDLCPTSNVQAGIYDEVADHPLARLHRAGVPVSLSTDDATVSDITLTDEYARAIDAIGLTPAELWTIDRHALDVAFADEATLAPLRVEFDAWAVAHRQLIR